MNAEWSKHVDSDGWVVSEAVRGERAEGRPVVALESTVIAHGLPRPRNLEVARALEGEVRAGGATPATIAVVGGVPHVGLEDPALRRLAEAEGVLKLSTRDLPIAMARGADGATTVAATAWLAARAGIEVFATGGIGGVHRGGGGDVSADLTELARTPVLVVCSGAKSILDRPATLEALETAGVLTLGWRTDFFPSFYSAGGDLRVDERVDDEAAVAAIWKEARRLGLPGGMLLCVPPPEEAALPHEEVEIAIDRALREAEDADVRGRDVTPFLLRAVAAATGGRSLEVNVALLRSNAGIAARVARVIAAP
jgi:pseudouridylate synthase